MANTPYSEGMAAGRLAPADYAQNFSDLHKPLDPHEAKVAADRCYFCHDAPCMTACPTDIDVPLFIRQIATDTPEAAATTILSQNILGGMCARVCPTETLCEEACVREVAEGKPVIIGQLQRYATDTAMKNPQPFSRAETTGKSVGVIGAGPAGLAAAHRLAMLGHEVTIYEAKPKPGGLNEYGIASYKSVDEFAQHEVSWLLEIGGITMKYGQEITSLETLRAQHDALFMGVGLSGTNALSLEGTDLTGVEDAVEFIARLRQADDLAALPVGRDVVVIGGGMTAVDAAVQAKLLGALNVTLAYRGPQERMKASAYEQELATAKGVTLLTNATPTALHGTGAVEAITFTYSDNGGQVKLPADHVLMAIGQSLGAVMPATEHGKITVDAQGRTSLEGVWAGGDCASGGDDLTVTAVAEGRDAAMDIHKSLMG